MTRGLSVRLAAALALVLLSLPATPRARAQATSAIGPRRPPITGVAGFAGKVSDMASARTFYNGVLGLDEAFTVKDPVGGPDLTAFKVNEKQYIYVAANLADPNDSRLDYVSFETTDARALRTYLASKSVTVPASVTPDPEGNLSFVVKDPEGNAVQFMQYLPASVHGRNKAKFLSSRRVSDHMLHVGYRIHDPDKIDTFYKDILGFRLMWKGGNRDDRFDWISMIVPDGDQWIEYMVNTGTPSARSLGVLNHLAFGTLDMNAAHAAIIAGGYTAQAAPKIGRDGRWLMDLYDPDFTRAEFMVRKPVQEPCCSPLHDVIGGTWPLSPGRRD